jgi:hypothetical protein
MGHGYCEDKIGEHHRREFVNEIETLGRKLHDLKCALSDQRRKKDAEKTFNRSVRLLPDKENAERLSEPERSLSRRPTPNAEHPIEEIGGS